MALFLGAVFIAAHLSRAAPGPRLALPCKMNCVEIEIKCGHTWYVAEGEFCYCLHKSKFCTFRTLGILISSNLFTFLQPRNANEMIRNDVHLARNYFPAFFVGKIPSDKSELHVRLRTGIWLSLPQISLLAFSVVFFKKCLSLGSLSIR